MKNILIVGGGISGMISAIFYSVAGHKVTIIEKSSSFGGLLKSFTCPEGYSFDYGTHFLRQTGVDEIDNEIFNNLPKDEWIFFQYLKTGNFFKNVLNEASPFVQSKLIGQSAYERGLEDFFKCKPGNEVYANLKDQLIETYGSTFYKYIHKPLLEKFYGLDPAKLAANSHHLVGLNRILIGSAEETFQLKTDRFNDERIGFHSYKDGVSDLRSIYPRTGGISKWIDHIEGILSARGVRMFTNRHVEEFRVENGSIVEGRLSNGERIEIDRLVWTIPVNLFLDATKTDYSKERPNFVKLNVCHYLSDKPPMTDAYYINCNEASFKTYRVTLHSNCQRAKVSKLYPFTVEEILRNNTSGFYNAKGVESEVKMMKIFDVESNIRLINKVHFDNAFPVPAVEDSQKFRDHKRKAHEVASNVSFIGKASGGAFFMNSIIIESYNDALSLI
jgi:protoporphyrinogen oxidase